MPTPEVRAAGHEWDDWFVTDDAQLAIDDEPHGTGDGVDHRRWTLVASSMLVCVTVVLLLLR